MPTNSYKYGLYDFYWISYMLICVLLIVRIVMDQQIYL